MNDPSNQATNTVTASCSVQAVPSDQYFITLRSLLMRPRGGDADDAVVGLISRPTRPVWRPSHEVVSSSHRCFYGVLSDHRAGIKDHLLLKVYAYIVHMQISNICS